MSDPRVLPYATPEERAAAAGAVAGHLRADGIIIYPTETVYGLGCLLRPAPLASLSRLKSREGPQGRKPFLLLVADRRDTPARVRWTDEAVALADRFWPGPLTLALEAEPGSLPPEVLSAHGMVAVRVSPHPGVEALLAAVRAPVTSTSANRPGEPAARSGEEAVALARSLPAEDVLVLDGGALPPSPPSTIVECGRRAVRVLRPGAVALEELREVVRIDG